MTTISNTDIQRILPIEIVNSPLMYVLVTNEAGNCLYMNPLVSKQLGIEIWEGQSFSIHSFVQKKDLELLNTTFSSCIQFPGQHFSAIIHHANPKSDERNVIVQWDLTAIISQQAFGKSILMMGYEMEKKKQNTVSNPSVKAEQGHQFDILALVAKNITNSVMITNASEEITWVNEVFTKVNGISLGDIRGKNINFLLKGAHIEIANKKRIREALDKKMPFHEEFFIKRDGSNTIWIGIDYLPLFDENEKHVGYMSIGTDETLRKEGQRKQEELITRLRLATDSAAIGIYEIDMVTNAVIWDEKMYALYGYTPDTTMNLYKIFFTSLHPDDAEMMNNILGELISQKKDISGAIYRIILPNGKIRHIESHAITRKSESGQVLSLIGTNRDITDDILIQEKIKKQNQLLRDIAFSQSHEVRKPLANILAVIEVLRMSGSIQELEIIDLLEDSAKELDLQIKSIVSKTNKIDDEVFR